MNPVAAEALFTAAVVGLDDRLLQARGWVIHSRAWPLLDISFRSDERAELRLRLGCDDWNDTPPSVDLLTSDGEFLTVIPKQRAVFAAGCSTSSTRKKDKPMTKRDKGAREDVLALLEDVADHDQTPDEAREELAGDRVNVSAFLARVQQTVDQQNKEERLVWRREAQKNVEAFNKSQDVYARFAAMGRAQLENEARRYASDIHFKNLEEQTDEDLRTLLADRARLEELSKK